MYQVWYKKDPTFRTDPNLCIKNLAQTHVMVKYLPAKDLNEVFTNMQAEMWSPRGEARDLIKSLGLHHTSMSVGDVIVDDSNGEHFEVASIGFRKLHYLPEHRQDDHIADSVV